MGCARTHDVRRPHLGHRNPRTTSGYSHRRTIDTSGLQALGLGQRSVRAHLHLRLGSQMRPHRTPPRDGTRRMCARADAGRDAARRRPASAATFRRGHSVKPRGFPAPRRLYSERLRRRGVSDRRRRAAHEPGDCGVVSASRGNELADLGPRRRVHRVSAAGGCGYRCGSGPDPGRARGGRQDRVRADAVRIYGQIRRAAGRGKTCRSDRASSLKLSVDTHCE